MKKNNIAAINVKVGDTIQASWTDALVTVTNIVRIPEGFNEYGGYHDESVRFECGDVTLQAELYDRVDTF